MPKRQTRTVYVIYPTTGGRKIATATGDKPPRIRTRYRGIGSGQPLRARRKTETERER